MRSFREQLEKDLDSTFFNLCEFAEPHTIDGTEIPVVVDNDKLLELDLGKNADTDGIYTADKLFFVQKKYLDDRPVIGQHMNFDGEIFVVTNVLDDMGGYTIILSGYED